MWDVVWTDPERKTRKEHRDRKLDKKSKQPRSDASVTTARSISSRSSTSASSFTGHFLSVSPGRKRAQRKVTTPSPTLSSFPTSPTTATLDTETDATSVFSVNYELTPTVSSQGPASIYEHLPLPERPQYCRSISSSSRRVASIYSLEAVNEYHPATPDSSTSASLTGERVALEPHRLVQTLCDGSFITRSTEVVTTTRPSCDTTMAISSEVIITADKDRKAIDRPSTAVIQSQLSLASLTSKSSAKSNSLPRILRRVASSQSTLRRENKDAWQPPNAWVCNPTMKTSLSSTKNDTSETIEDTTQLNNGTSTSMTLNNLQQEVQQLADESNRVRLLRLSRVWDTLVSSGRKELSVEEIQWMLSALHNMGDEQHFIRNRSDRSDPITTGPSKVLALYETPAVTSYLAGIYQNTQIYHLSSAPLSHTLFPNIHPVSVPGRSLSPFPLASSLFESVHSLQLPVLTPSQEIPSLLKDIHRCLQPGGTLHLTIIDPLPSASSLGPLLRSWIEQHLLINLETNFCCTNPSKLFPIWLAKCSLHVEADETLSHKFFAVSTNAEPLSLSETHPVSVGAIEQELQNIIGRMAWIEIWKDYIVADYWWWEEPKIMEECATLQTVWTWHEIKARKQP